MKFGILGTLEVSREGGLAMPKAAKQRELLAALLISANEVVSNDALIDALWGDRAPRSAGKLVQVYVSQLRNVLDPARGARTAGHRLRTVAPGYLLQVTGDELDRDRFERLLTEGLRARRAGNPEIASRVLAEALALWRGPALVEFAYAEFAQDEARRLEELRLTALEERIEADLALGRHREVVPELERLASEHPLRERFRGQLMLTLYRCGRQAEALESYRETRRVLDEGLGLQPSSDLQRLERAILNQEASLAVGPAAAEPRATLPTPATTLVGRDSELEALSELILRDAVRLVTLTGPGGTGKTRLAVEVARRIGARFANGVVFVPLAPIGDPARVVSELARSLGVAESPEEPVAETLKHRLAPKESLLVLDNFEQVLDAGPLLIDLLAFAPRVKLLVTSRSLLRLSGEHAFAVPALELPERTRIADLRTVSQYESVKLFIERAEEVRRGFSITDANAPAVAEICTRLDGLPLAIELAAATVRALTPEALLARLEQRLPIPTGGAQDLPRRHQTLRATLDWSHELLKPRDQRLFARLALFVGGCAIDTAENVCESDEAANGQVLEGLTRLLDINLVRQTQEGGEPRFRMLETIREYALERLDGSGETEAVVERFTRYYLDLAEEAEPQLRGEAQLAWLERLEREHDNFRAALKFAEKLDPAVQLRLAAALWRFWWVRGYLTEGREWLESALRSNDASASEERGKACEGAAAIAWGQGDLVPAKELASEALRLYRELDEARGVARSLTNLGLLFQEEGDYASAEASFRESGSIARELGNERGFAVSVLNLGGLALIRGDEETARELCGRALALHRSGENKEGQAISLLNLGFSAVLAGRYEDAVELLGQSLQLFREIGFRQYIAYCLEGFAAVLAARGENDQAAHVLGVAEVVREQAGASLDTFERRLHERTVASARSALGELAFTTAWAEGRSTDPEAAALALLEAYPSRMNP